MAEAASFQAGGAPLSGLGNFKGVMLCNRPSDAPPTKLGAGDGPAPFKSMVAASANEQLGLPPVKSEEGPPQPVKKRGPSAALRQHVRWLKELQEQMGVDKLLVEEEDRMADEKKQRLKDIASKHREGVRQMMEERDGAAKKATEKPEKAKKKEKVVKPLWAMTSQEKEDFENGEADDLINFAAGLDFDKYVGDMEFRSSLEALKDRTGKLHKETEAFKDALLADFNAKMEEEDEETSAGGSPRSLNLQDGLEGQSVLGGSEYSVSSSRRSKGAERYGKERGSDWDGSTCCGDAPQVNHELQDQATQVLESAPQIRAIHSKASVQKMIEKVGAQTTQPQGDLLETMKREGPVQVPVITSSEDTQQRLQKKPDPSQLPYLYRSPAV